jgi:UDP-N-acetylglucosamine 2-epimerase (hydrolysing)
MKKILFVTGTRADFGKLKSLIETVEREPLLENHIFVTGMHTLKDFGDTKTEVFKSGFKNIHVYMNQVIEEPMDLVLANTINGFGRFIRDLSPDLVVVHGDRVEALGAAISAAINNILVAHIEGGEQSGSIDESIRHAISQFAHIHFATNELAKEKLISFGENPNSIFIIGSPDLDIINKVSELDIITIKKRYDILFDEYAIVLFHPVTTELHNLRANTKIFVQSLIDSGLNFVVINPNNDSGFREILDEYSVLLNNPKFKIFPSIRFEYFIELLKNSQFIIGNSSAGIHEAPYIGIPSINVGTRQFNRFSYPTILNVDFDINSILGAINKTSSIDFAGTSFFGDGMSSKRFNDILLTSSIWNTPLQKEFLGDMSKKR